MKKIAVVVADNKEGAHAMKFAVETFGKESKFILLGIYTFEGKVGSSTVFPHIIRTETIRRLKTEMEKVKTSLGCKELDVIIDCKFGSTKHVLESCWKEKLFDVAVLHFKRLSWFDRLFSTNQYYSPPCSDVPILTVPQGKKNSSNEISFKSKDVYQMDEVLMKIEREMGDRNN